MLNAFLLLIALQLIGELIVERTGAPVPGMVVGLLLLLGLLVLRGHHLDPQRAVPAGLDAVAKGLHGHLGLLFVPAGAGILTQGGQLAIDGIAILAAVLLSTVAALTVTARLAAKWPNPQPAESPRSVPELPR